MDSEYGAKVHIMLHWMLYTGPRYPTSNCFYGRYMFSNCENQTGKSRNAMDIWLMTTAYEILDTTN